MTNFTTTYHCRIYKMGESILSFLAGMIIVGLVVFWVFKVTGNALVAAVSWTAPQLCMVFFAQKFREAFTYATSIKFDKEGMTVKEFCKDEVTLNKEEVINWSELVGYRFYFGNKGVIQLFLYFRNGKSRTLFFNGAADETETMKKRSVFSILYAFVASYNADKSPVEQIVMKGGILNETKGKVILILTALAAIVAVIFKIRTSHGYPSFLLVLVTVIVNLAILLTHATAQARLRRMSKLQPLTEDQLTLPDEPTSLP